MGDAEAGGGEALVGISLSCEAYTHDPTQDVCLGLVSLPLANVTVSSLRTHITAQLQTLPVTFSFLTRQGWPISPNQEATLTVSQLLSGERVIRIQRSYDKPRIGVKTYDGMAIGFVFSELSSSISDLRETIHRQLVYVGNSVIRDYQFLDRNNWPISRQQESCLCVIDALVGGAVRLLPCNIKINPAIEDGSHKTDHMDYHADESSSKRRKLTQLRQLTFCSSKDIDRSIGSNSEDEITFQAKQILISYVRAEASQHALCLKKQLINLGYSVYLDVHEIKSGIDWQDALNYAVSNCEIFIPLVTHRYGLTQWTNREVKLADVLDKMIVPVNFLESWPPKCLAIQFATTQYVPWKSQDAIKQEIESKGNNFALDIRYWDVSHVRNVAKQLGERLKHYDQKITEAKHKKVALVRKLSLRSYPAPLPEGTSIHLSQEISSDREGNPLIVIGAHIQQQEFCNNLRTLLESENFDVWCTTELEDGITLTQVPPDLSSIPESPSESEEDSSVCLSQLSQMSNFSAMHEPENLSDKSRKKFQEKADEAGVVVFVLSKAFAASKSCQEQVFYCEHRKRVIPLRYEEFCMPGWLSMLIGTGMFEDARAEGYEESLKERVKRAVDPTGREGTLGEVNEEKIDCQVRSLRKRLPKEIGVYVAGSTTFFHKNSQSICRSIGKHLSLIDNIQVVTGGFYGVGETVGKTYDEERTKLNKVSNIWHVLPEKDDQDRSHQSRQNKDRTFPLVPYGKTVYSGESVREREIIVSRVFDICILVEGGPGAAHEAEQFVWNDHIVIPVKCTGGAAEGKFNVPEKVFEVPPGVNEADWFILQDKSRSSDEIGQAVARIVSGVRESLKLDSPGDDELPSPHLSPSSTASKQKKLGRTRSTLSKMKRFVFTSPLPQEEDEYKTSQVLE